MAETVQEHDFIEVDYTGRLEDGTIFDTTEEKVAKEHHLHREQGTARAVVICVGEKQILPGLDAEIVGKEIGKEYTITLPPEKAFGKRDIKKMKIVPSSTFKEHKLDPQPGLQIDVDGEMGIITRVSGGRVIVNFNHPLAGKVVTYSLKINKKLTDPKEQITAFLQSTLRIPQEHLLVTITEQKAVVELPFSLPAQIGTELGKKIAQLTKLESVELKIKEKK